MFLYMQLIIFKYLRGNARILTEEPTYNLGMETCYGDVKVFQNINDNIAFCTM